MARGVRAEKDTTFRFAGSDVKVLIRPLSALEEADVTADAIKFAKSKGSEALEGRPIYEAAFAAGALAISCLDPDSPADARSPLFDKGATQVLSELDTDTIAQLFEQHRLWQEECSPYLKTKSAGELFDLAKRVAQENDPFSYVRMSPRTRWLLQHSTAALLVALQAFKPSPSPV